MSVEQAIGKAHICTLSAAAVALPTALCLLTVWALHSRHFTVGIVQQAVLPTRTAGRARLAP